MEPTIHRWGKTVEWANEFIRAHGRAQRQVGKPVVGEEYGWLSPEKRLEYLGAVSNSSRVEVVGGWQKIFVQERLGGDLYWQFGLQQGLSSGSSHDVRLSCFVHVRMWTDDHVLPGWVHDLFGE